MSNINFQTLTLNPNQQNILDPQKSLDILNELFEQKGAVGFIELTYSCPIKKCHLFVKEPHKRLVTTFINQILPSPGIFDWNDTHQTMIYKLKTFIKDLHNKDKQYHLGSINLATKMLKILNQVEPLESLGIDRLLCFEDKGQDLIKTLNMLQLERVKLCKN